MTKQALWSDGGNVTKKGGEINFGVEIHNIVNTNLIIFVEIFSKQKEGYNRYYLYT